MSDMPPTPPADTTHPQYPDDDWYALIDYLTGEASPVDREAVQRRLTDDPAFATFAAPIIQLWKLPRAKGTWDADANWAII
ncbi:MAG TPA: hypothetical protein VNU46_08835, partial [Gemmatimonadaceae bacterium]|nr:hypothetical protein [Gemmatimonadaceae bacterium]